MPRPGLPVLTILLIAGIHCSKKETPSAPVLFEPPVAVEVTGNVPMEVSGMADSHKNPGFCWVNQDSDNPPEIILINHNGQVTTKVYLKGATNNDWEDIATTVIPGSTERQVLIAETGNNYLQKNEFIIYRFPEPLQSQDTLTDYQSIRFSYSDGSYDAEAILGDASGDIYLITKRDTRSRVYKIAYPQSLSAVNTAQFVGELPYGGVVSATLSPSGNEVIVKTYSELKYYERKTGQSIADCLQQIPIGLFYQLEPMGEAITFAADGNGFYTLSEKISSNPLQLYFYKRK